MNPTLDRPEAEAFRWIMRIREMRPADLHEPHDCDLWLDWRRQLRATRTRNAERYILARAEVQRVCHAGARRAGGWKHGPLLGNPE